MEQKMNSTVILDGLIMISFYLHIHSFFDWTEMLRTRVPVMAFWTNMYLNLPLRWTSTRERSWVLILASLTHPLLTQEAFAKYLNITITTHLLLHSWCITVHTWFLSLIMPTITPTPALQIIVSFHFIHSIVSGEAHIEALVYNENRLSLLTSFVHFAVSIYPLLYTVIIAYRMLSDNDSGRRAMLYLHNITTGIYATSILVFGFLLMLVVAALCLLILIGSNVIASHLIFTTILCFIISALSCATFTVFVAMVIHAK